MNCNNYLIIHKDHLLDVQGVNSGAEMATLFLARYLARMGKKVVVAGQLKNGVESADRGVDFWDLGSSFDVRTAVQRAARELGSYHVISAGRAQPIFEVRGDEHCVSRTLISHDRSGNDTGIHPKVLCQLVDQVICVSQAQKDVFIAAGADPEKVKVIHNGVDLELFAAGDVEQRDYKRLVFVGALVQDKGVDLLIHAYSALLQKYPDLKLDIYGSAGLWGRGEIFDTAGIEKKWPGIKFHGAVKQDIISRAYRNAGICVVPSIWFDPFPLTSIEAQASGCPVLTFDIGGLGEGVLPGCGLVLQEISPDSLTRGLDQLLSDRQQLKQISRNALEKARAYYRWERVADSIVSLCDAASSGPSRMEKRSTSEGKPFGMLTTWNQECGLATYASYMLSAFDTGSYCVFAEQSADARLDEDQEFVARCWNRKSQDYSQLEQAIEKSGIGLLYLNAQARFFQYPAFGKFIERIRRRGIKVIAHLHSVFTLDQAVQELGHCVDHVIVHTPENRLEAIANGIQAEKITVVQHGVQPLESINAEQREQLRRKLSLPLKSQIVCSFGFVQPHKGMHGLIESIAELRKNNFDVHGVIAGSAHAEDPNSIKYLQDLKRISEQLGVAQHMSFIDRFITNDQVSEYLQAADLVLMNYQSQHYEASGACSLAVGAGAVVATSIAPPFAAFGDAVWHISSGFPTALSLASLLGNAELRAELMKNAQSYAQKYSWTATRAQVQQIFRRLNFTAHRAESTNFILTNREESVVTQPTNAGRNAASSLRILVQSRPNSFTQRGGDTVVLEKMVQGLKARGLNVTVDVENRCSPADFDIVHLFNFALPDLLRQQAERAVAANVPFVVTTLNEDVTHFFNQATAMAHFLTEYVRRGQDSIWYAEHRQSYINVQGCKSFDNSWIVRQAACLLTNGESESASLRRDYGNISNVKVIRLGCDIGFPGNPALFEREYGVKDFVLCVGRIESRKNQLMLLKALENVEVPVVLAGGGFTYQPEYAQAVKNFKRKGQTIVTGRISEEMLASAYAAAKVHALPSWYELPGLVSLEAASYGCNVVATERGTARDYLGPKAFYCDPASEESIRNAVLAAYYGPKQEGLDTVVRQYTWDRVAQETYELYQEICPRRIETIPVQPSMAARRDSSISQPSFAFSFQPEVGASSGEFQAWLEKGEAAAQEKNFAEAHRCLEQAERFNASSARVFRARAAVFMAQENQAQARFYFEKAIAIDPQDPKTLSGLGMCDMMQNSPEKAYPRFVAALKKDPAQMVAMLQLIECAYRLGRYDDLERVLQRYVEKYPDDIEMQFCYAGCLYKLGRIEKARELGKHVQSVSPNHLGARDLLDAIAKKDMQAQDSGSLASAGRPNSQQLGSLVEKESVPQAASSFSSIDRQIVELEDKKKQKEYQAVLEGCDNFLRSPLLNAKQKETLTLLRAEALVFLDRSAEADVIFKQVLCDNPASARALCGQAALVASRGEWGKARELFEEANRMAPNYDVSFAGLGMCASSAGQNQEAWSYFESALKLNPENGSALLGMLELAYKLNRHSELERAIQNYLDMHPADLNFLYSLAGCLYAQGKLREALSEVQKITLFEPQHKNALELKQMIDQKLASVAVQY